MTRGEDTRPLGNLQIEIVLQKDQAVALSVDTF